MELSEKIEKIKNGTSAAIRSKQHGSFDIVKANGSGKYVLAFSRLSLETFDDFSEILNAYFDDIATEDIELEPKDIKHHVPL